MPRAWLALPSFAKINLSLEILGARADGFTEIRTIYQTVTLHDRLRLRLTSRPGIRLKVVNGGAPSGSRNLVHKALRRGVQLIGWRGGVEVELEKRIPAERGLGGGSSNAAAALIGLLRLTGATLPPGQLEKMCAGLGSDVPFFLHGGTALGVGRGEEVFPLSAPPHRWCVLFSPPFGVPTAEAYARARLTLSRRPANITGLGPLRGTLWAAGNDFDPVVFSRFPQLGRWRSSLLKYGAELCVLSGSGSGLVALFSGRGVAARAARGLPDAGTVVLAETLSEAEYRRKLGWTK